jgi:hypothetical protein
LDIEHRIRRFTLREDLLVRSIFGDAPAAIYGGEKYFRVKWNFFLFTFFSSFAMTVALWAINLV